MQTSQSTAPGALAGRTVSAVTQAILAGLLGAFLLWGVGFSALSAVHNAAHDARHSSGFPCH